MRGRSRVGAQTWRRSRIGVGGRGRSAGQAAGAADTGRRAEVGRRAPGRLLLGFALATAVLASGCASTPPAPAETAAPTATAGASSPTARPPSASQPAPSSTPGAVGWTRVQGVENPAGFLTVHHDALGRPTVSCAPCHPAVDTLMTDAVAGPGGIVAVGWVIQEFRGATWWSVDGARWSMDADFPQVSMLRSVAANDERYVAAGRRGDGATTWTSPDGRRWTASSSPAFARSPLRIESVARLGDGFVAAELGGRRLRHWAGSVLDVAGWPRLDARPGHGGVRRRAGPGGRGGSGGRGRRRHDRRLRRARPGRRLGLP